MSRFAHLRGDKMVFWMEYEPRILKLLQEINKSVFNGGYLISKNREPWSLFNEEVTVVEFPNLCLCHRGKEYVFVFPIENDYIRVEAARYGEDMLIPSAIKKWEVNPSFDEELIEALQEAVKHVLSK